jgi:hypothetical protein
MCNKNLFAIGAVIGVGLFLFKFLNLYLGVQLNLTFLTNKSNLGPLRLLNFAVLSYIISYLLYKYRNAGKFQPIVFLGQHSLQVFAFHVLITILMVPLAEKIQFQVFDNELVNHKFITLLKMGIYCLIVLSLYIPAYLHEKSIKKKQVKVSNKFTSINH